MKSLVRVLESLPTASVAAVLRELENAQRENRTVYIVGNGGSAATASHMACDLAWSLARGGVRPLRAISLSDGIPIMTAIANDTSYEEIFSRQLETLASANDVLIAISASGNSPNVVRALETAKRMGMRTIGFLGMGGGRAKDLVHEAVVVPADDYGRVEDVHMVLDHLTTAYLKAALAR